MTTRGSAITGCQGQLGEMPGRRGIGGIGVHGAQQGAACCSGEPKGRVALGELDQSRHGWHAMRM
jgi:hypothetical protein